jgi:large subunit ribosomal protein L15
VKLHDLKPAPGSQKRRIRVGRGIAAGRGKTAGRGTKGQKSRSGASIPGWFEGGQTPIHVRVPKLRGFKPVNRIDYQVVNVGRISEYAAAGRFGESGKGPITVNGDILAAAGLISHADRPVKVLGDGDLEVKVAVTADAFTASARSKIEDAGGSVELLNPPAPEPEPEAPAEEAAPEAAAEPEEPKAQPEAAPEPVEEATPAEAAADETAPAKAESDVSDEPAAE